MKTVLLTVTYLTATVAASFAAPTKDSGVTFAPAARAGVAVATDNGDLRQAPIVVAGRRGP